MAVSNSRAITAIKSFSNPHISLHQYQSDSHKICRNNAVEKKKSPNEHDETGEEDGGEISVVKNPSNADIMDAFKGMEKQIGVKIDKVLLAVMEVTKRMTEAEECILGPRTRLFN